MAIYSIPTLAKAQEIMQQAYLYPWSFNPIIFDLDESLDPNDVEVSISKCDKCSAVVHFKLCAENEAECPRCRESTLRELVVVQLVIQGPVVVSTYWRD
jgi:hypothetical protein